MTDAIENFVSWYQGLPQAAQIGIPIAGAAGVYFIAKHKGGVSGSQVTGPTSSGSSDGGGTSVGPSNPTPVIAPGPPAPGSPPPVHSFGPPVPAVYWGSKPTPSVKPPGGGSGGTPVSHPVSQVIAKAPTLSGPNKGPIVAPYTYPVSFGKPLPGASHPIYTGQGNSYIVNGQDIAKSGTPPKIRPHTQIGPTPAAQKAHVTQADVKGSAKPLSSEARQHQAVARGFSYPRPAPVRHPAPVVTNRSSGLAAVRGGRGLS